MIGEVVDALHEALTESDPIERFVFVEEQNSLSVKRSDTFHSGSAGNYIISVISKNWQDRDDDRQTLILLSSILGLSLGLLGVFICKTSRAETGVGTELPGKPFLFSAEVMSHLSAVTWMSEKQ